MKGRALRTAVVERIVADENAVAAVDETGHLVARRETDGWKEPFST